MGFWFGLGFGFGFGFGLGLGFGFGFGFGLGFGLGLGLLGSAPPGGLMNRLALTLFLTLGCGAAGADVAAPDGLKWVAGKVVFTNLEAFEGTTFVLAELSGPTSDKVAVAVEDGVALSEISYRWFRPTLIAVRGDTPSSNAELTQVAQRFESYPHTTDFETGSGSLSETAPATTIRVTYRVVAVSETGIELQKVSEVGLDASGKEASTEGTGGLGALALAGALAGAALLGLLGLMVLHKRKATP